MIYKSHIIQLNVQDVDASQALQRLTDPLAYSLHRVPSIGAVVTHATSKLAIKPEEAPIASDVLNEILLVIFEDNLIYT